MPDQALGELIDELYTTRQARLGLEKQAEALKAEETRLKGLIIGQLKSVELTAGRGTRASVSIKPKKYPGATDWEAIREYIKAHDAWDVLEKRLSVKACQDRLGTSDEVPGLSWVDISDLSVTKVSS